ncbi:MAG: hypothetical protein JNK77_12630 [Saprospiraceae bacterium]|nr:hypothetical protein [Saprospiraceae bacterium]
MNARPSLISAISLLLFPFFLIAQKQTQLQGYVVERNSGGKRLANVSIDAPKAQPTRSGGSGEFILVFSGVEIGEPVSLTVEKTGYEVVNKKDIEDLIPNRKTPLKIILSPLGAIDRDRAQYYEINMEALKKGLRERIAVLEAAGKQKDELLRELSRQMNKQITDKDEAIGLLQEQFERQKAKARELSELFATQNLDDLSETYRQAFSFYQQGEIEKAVSFLESANIPGRLEALNYNEKQYNKVIATYQDSVRINDSLRQDEIDKLVLLARLQYQSLEFEKADSSYRLAIFYSRNKHSIVTEYSEFLYKEGRFTEAFEQISASIHSATSLTDTLTAWFFQGLYAAVNNQYEVIDSQAIKLSYLLAPLKKTNPCQYGLLSFYSHAMAAFSSNSALSNQAADELAVIYRQIDTIYCGDITEDERSTIKALISILLNVYHSEDPVLSSFYINELTQMKIADNKFLIFVQITHQNQMAKNYLSEGDWTNLDATLTNIDRLYSQADTTVKRMMKMPIAEIYIDIGSQLLNQQFFDLSKLYYTKGLALLRQLNPNDPLERRVYLSIVLIYNNLAYMHTLPTNQNMDEVRENSKKARFHSTELRKKGFLTADNHWENMWYYNNNLMVAEWISQDFDKALTHIIAASAYSDSLAQSHVDQIAIQIQRNSDFINVFFNFVNQPNGDRFLAPARQFIQKAVHQLISYPIADTIKLYHLPYYTRMQLYFDHFTPQCRNYLNLLYEIWNMENQVFQQPNSPANYQMEKNIIAQIDKALFVKKDDPFLNYMKAQNLGSLAWAAILNSQFAEAEQSAKKALELAPGETWIYSNLAAAFLLQDQYDAARQVYAQYADQPADMLNTRQMRALFLADLDYFEQKGINHKDFKKIKALLEKE